MKLLAGLLLALLALSLGMVVWLSGPGEPVEAARASVGDARAERSTVELEAAAASESERVPEPAAERLAVERPDELPADQDQPALEPDVLPELGPAEVRFRLRALDASGAPLEDRDLQLWTDPVAEALPEGVGREFLTLSARLTTDAFGDAESPSFGFADLGQQRTVRVRALLGPPEALRPGEAQVVLAELAAGIHDLGDLVLFLPEERFPEPIVAGRLLDAEGQGIADVRVGFVLVDEAGAMRPGSSFSASSSAADGAFSIHGDPTDVARVQLLSTLPEVGLPFLDLDQLPRTDVVWQVESGRRLTGRVLFPERLDPAGLRVTAMTETGDAHYFMRPVDVGGDGRFEHPLEHSLQTLIVGENSPISPEGLLRIDASEFPPADADGSVDLGDLDLRELVVGRRLQVLHTDGLPPATAQAALVLGESVDELSKLLARFRPLGESGELEVLLPVDEIELSVIVRGESIADGEQVFGPFTLEDLPDVLTLE